MRSSEGAKKLECVNHGGQSLFSILGSIAPVFSRMFCCFARLLVRLGALYLSELAGKTELRRQRSVVSGRSQSGHHCKPGRDGNRCKREHRQVNCMVWAEFHCFSLPKLSFSPETSLRQTERALDPRISVLEKVN